MKNIYDTSGLRPEQHRKNDHRFWEWCLVISGVGHSWNIPHEDGLTGEGANQERIQQPRSEVYEYT